MRTMIMLFLLLNFSLAAQPEEGQQVAHFTRLNVFGPFDVELIKSDKDYVELQFRGVDEDDVIHEVNRGELELKLRNSHYFDNWSSDRDPYPGKYIKARIYYKNLKEIHIQAGAKLVTREALTGDEIFLNCSKGAEAKVNVEGKNFEVKASMGAQVQLIGKVERLEVKSGMGAVLRATHLECKVAFIKASMGAEVSVNVTEEIEVSAGLGSTVNYIGHPGVRHVSRSLGAEIYRRDN